MVAYKHVKAANALISDDNAPRVAVFVGGTSGIGKLTIRALVGTGASLRIYLVGRKASEERTRLFIQELRTINPRAEVVWTEGEVSLLAETARICNDIKSRESQIDLLFLTTGYAPFGARRETTEGIEISQSLSYYTRMLFTLHLLPLLKKSEHGRVVTVLGGAMERFGLNLDDLDLKKPGSWGATKAQPHYFASTTVFLDKLAAENHDVVFMHTCPGWVDTGNVWRGLAADQWVLSWFVGLILAPLIRLFSFSDEEAGGRNLFQCTSAAFGRRGVPWEGRAGINTMGRQDGGLFLVGSQCESSPNAGVVPALRDRASERVWRHTHGVLRPYL